MSSCPIPELPSQALLQSFLLHCSHAELVAWGLATAAFQHTKVMTRCLFVWDQKAGSWCPEAEHRAGSPWLFLLQKMLA